MEDHELCRWWSGTAEGIRTGDRFEPAELKSSWLTRDENSDANWGAQKH